MSRIVVFAVREDGASLALNCDWRVPHNIEGFQ
ncbi:hypothetical protein VSDKYIMU_CDS0147 [Enterococcus phage VRE9_4]